MKKRLLTQKIIFGFFFVLMFLAVFAPVCDNFQRIYAQSVTGVTLPDQAKVWDRNGNLSKTLLQTKDTNFACIGSWGEAIKIPVFAGEALKYRGSGDDAIVFDYTKQDGKLAKKFSISDSRFNGLKQALVDLNVNPSALDPIVFPEPGFIVFQPSYNSCEHNELFLSVCGCTNDCNLSGARECTDKTITPNSFKSCGNFDEDACLEWSATTACSAATPTCDENGNCVPPCKNECQKQGATQCIDTTSSPNTLQECGNFDSDTCLEWGTAKKCPDSSPACDIKGNCVSGCLNDCPAANAKLCSNTAISPNLYRTCGNFDGDTCLEWGNQETCTNLKPICDANGNCSCINDCTVSGKSECIDTKSEINSYRVCGNFDPDPCYEYGPVKSCTFDAPLCDTNSGKCIEKCTDECNGENSGECVDSNSFRSCGNFDTDSCLEWGKAIQCPAESLCDANSGKCAIKCVDECSQKGAKRCLDKTRIPNTVEECGNFDSDSCLEWGAEKKCDKAKPACTGEGDCVSFCFNECNSEGEKKCADSNSAPGAFKVCGNFDSDPCLEWNTPEKCPDGTPACDANTAKCIASAQKDIVSQIFEFINNLLKSIGIGKK